MKLRPYESTYNTLIYTAKKKNIIVSITYEDFLIFTFIDTCYYCNEKINWVEHRKTNQGGLRYYLDRINNNKGYEIGNILVACAKCNLKRGNKFTAEEFYSIQNNLYIKYSAEWKLFNYHWYKNLMEE